MGRTRWVIWGSVFALLAYTFGGVGLVPAVRVCADSTELPTVCATQATIATALCPSTSGAEIQNICRIQQILELSSEAPASVPQLPTDSTSLLVSVPQRTFDLPEIAVAEPAALIIAAEDEPVRACYRCYWEADGIATASDSRYLFLLTPHAPPTRA